MNQMLGEFHLPNLFPSNPEHCDVTDDPVNIEQCRFDWPNDLIDRIKQVMSSSCTTPSPPEFKFEMTEGAIEHNLEVLEKHEFSLKKAWAQERSSGLQTSFVWSLASTHCGIGWKPSSRTEANGR